jgi:hypothetical protein
LILKKFDRHKFHLRRILNGFNLSAQRARHVATLGKRKKEFNPEGGYINPMNKKRKTTGHCPNKRDSEKRP